MQCTESRHGDRSSVVSLGVNAVVCAVFIAIPVASTSRCPSGQRQGAIHDEPGGIARAFVESKTQALKARFSAADSLRSRGFLRSSEAVRFPEQPTSFVQLVPPQCRRRSDPLFRRSEKTRKFAKHCIDISRWFLVKDREFTAKNGLTNV